MIAIERGMRIAAIGGLSALLFLGGRLCWERLGPAPEPLDAFSRPASGLRAVAAPSPDPASAPAAVEVGEVCLPADLPEVGTRLMAIAVGRDASERRSVLAAFRLAEGKGKEFVQASFRERGWSAERAPAALAVEGGEEVFLYTKGRRQCLVHLSGGSQGRDPEALVLCDR